MELQVAASAARCAALLAPVPEGLDDFEEEDEYEDEDGVGARRLLGVAQGVARIGAYVERHASAHCAKARVLRDRRGGAALTLYFEDSDVLYEKRPVCVRAFFG